MIVTIRRAASGAQPRAGGPRPDRVRILKSLHRQLGEAVKQATAKPNDSMVLLALAEATIAQFDASGKGDLDRALAAARRAAKLAPACFEAIYWEARCQEAAGRARQAFAGFGDFIEIGKTRVRCKNLVRDAEKRRRAASAQ